MRRILISIVILSIILALGCEVSEDKTGGIPSNPITPPRVAIKSGPTGMINTPDISFTWEDVTPYEPKPVLLYSYRLVGLSDNWLEWTSATEVDFVYLLDGKYTFEVKAVDLAGHISDKPATRSFTLDTVPPNTLIKSGPSGVISTNKVVFTWMGSDNLTPTPQLLYSYRLHNTLWSTWISATQVEITDLNEGEYTFYVRAKDKAGNVEANPAIRSFTVQ